MGGIAEILSSRQFPGVSVYRVEGYDATLARYPGDPNAFVSSKRDREEKSKRAGTTLVDVDCVIEQAKRACKPKKRHAIGTKESLMEGVEWVQKKLLS